MSKDLNTTIDDIKYELLNYINRRLTLLKLTSYEKVSKSASFIGFGMIVLAIAAMIVFFISLGLAFFIGELLNSLAAGFGIMALFSLLVLLVVFLFKKKVKRSLLNKTILFIRKVEKDDDED